jgi:hypothetical protein
MNVFTALLVSDDPAADDDVLCPEIVNAVMLALQ